MSVTAGGSVPGGQRVVVGAQLGSRIWDTLRWLGTISVQGWTAYVSAVRPRSRGER